MVTARPPGPAAKLPAAQSAIAAANIRVLRPRHGWTQAHLGQLMGWTAPPPCATPKATERAGNAASPLGDQPTR